MSVHIASAMGVQDLECLNIGIKRLYAKVQSGLCQDCVRTVSHDSTPTVCNMLHDNSPAHPCEIATSATCLQISSRDLLGPLLLLLRYEEKTF